MVNTKYKTTEGLIIKLQNSNRETKVKFRQNKSDNFDQMNFMRQSITFRFEEDIFSKFAPGIAFIKHEPLFLLNFLQSKLQDKSNNINYFDLYYTIIESLSDDGGEN